MQNFAKHNKISHNEQSKTYRKNTSPHLIQLTTSQSKKYEEIRVISEFLRVLVIRVIFQNNKKIYKWSTRGCLMNFRSVLFLVWSWALQKKQGSIPQKILGPKTDIFESKFHMCFICRKIGFFYVLFVKIWGILHFKKKSYMYTACATYMLSCTQYTTRNPGMCGFQPDKFQFTLREKHAINSCHTPCC